MERKRIASLSPATTEILFDLGLEDQVVGVTENCQALSSSKALLKSRPGGTLPRLGPWGSPDYPRLQELNPGLIFISGKFMDDVPAQLRQEGYRVEHFDPCTLDELLSSVSRMGEVTGKVREAERMVRSARVRLARIDHAVARLRHRPTVYCEKCYHPSEEMVEQDGSSIVMVAGGLIPDLVGRAGGEYGLIPVGGDFRWIPETAVVEYNPEVILLNTCGGCDRLWPSDLTRREGWENIRAMKEKKVFDIPVGLGKPTLRVLRGLELVFTVLHPDEVLSAPSGKGFPTEESCR